MLTREFLESADCRTSFGPVEERLLLSTAQRSASLHNFLSRKPTHGPLWIFGYGSLMWNPLLNYDQVETACLDGWSRDFCLTLIAGRGNAEQPGRMLALVKGGNTVGRAFKLSCDSWESELALLWKREMLTGCYRPLWQTLRFNNGETVDGLVFVANPEHPLFNRHEDPVVKAQRICAAQGPLGKNLTYFEEMIRTLEAFGIEEPKMQALTEHITKLSTELNKKSSD